MKIVLSIGILAFLAVPALADETIILSGVAPREVAGAVLEMRAWDPATRTIVLVGESGREQVLRVDDRTLAAVSRLSPGDRLLVSYRFNRNGEAEVILRGIPVGQAPVRRVQAVVASEPPSGLRVSVVSSEPAAGTLTIRGERGDVRRLSVDADLTEWRPHFVTGLLGPLLANEDIQLVRAAYTRIRSGADGSVTFDGGRLTELVARPLLSLYWPELTGVVQPLAGEWAVRRSLMEALPIPVGYGVELSTLLDTASRYGLDAIAQVHLGRRAHWHRSDREMALAATELLAVTESRRSPAAGAGSGSVWLQQFEPTTDGWGTPVTRMVAVDERPPVAGVRAATRAS